MTQVRISTAFISNGVQLLIHALDTCFWCQSSYLSYSVAIVLQSNIVSYHVISGLDGIDHADVVFQLLIICINALQWNAIRNIDTVIIAFGATMNQILPDLLTNFALTQP